MILGPTGSGKTILLETIAGVYRPDSGRVLLNGVDVTSLPPRERNVGMVYQDYMLFPHLTVEQNIAFGLRFMKPAPAGGKRSVRRLAELLGVEALLHRYPGTLSGGEQQRTAIVRALIVEPDVLLLDEPLSALEARTKEKLRDELLRLHRLTHTTIVHVTHGFDEAFLLGNRMAIMNQGRVEQVGEPTVPPGEECSCTFCELFGLARNPHSLSGRKGSPGGMFVPAHKSPFPQTPDRAFHGRRGLFGRLVRRTETIGLDKPGAGLYQKCCIIFDIYPFHPHVFRRSLAGVGRTASEAASWRP